MKRLYSIILILAMSLAGLSAQAAFIVREVKGNVTVSKGGQEVALKAGMKVTPADKVTIPQGGQLKVTNDVNNNIYTSTHDGTFTISRMMLDADVEAGSNISAINSRLKVGGAGTDKGQRVYVEQGMVKRSLSEYDPQASAFTIDPYTLARCIRESGERGRVNGSDAVGQDGTSVVRRLERSADGALTLELTNTEAFPIYFNVISRDLDGSYNLSCLGQPAGSYVLLPRQGIMRNHPDAVDPEQKQLLIVANCSFDVDLLLEELNKQPEHDPDPLPEFPLQIMYF